MISWRQMVQVEGEEIEWRCSIHQHLSLLRVLRCPEPGEQFSKNDAQSRLISRGFWIFNSLAFIVFSLFLLNKFFHHTLGCPWNSSSMSVQMLLLFACTLLSMNFIAYADVEVPPQPNFLYKTYPTSTPSWDRQVRL